ncbi:MAG: hypothetical protein GC165_14050 [Armatimonadetes bacterium]|nr:hypothetical protein [Armatimonadota bacterium]
MKGILLVVGLMATVLANAQDLFGDGKQTYLLMPAEVISSGIVSNVSVSLTSRYVLFRRNDVPSPDKLIVSKSTEPGPWYYYDRTTKKSKPLPVPKTAIDVAILGDGVTAFFFGGPDRSSQGFVNLDSGAVRKTSIDIQHLDYLGELPSAPYVVATDEGKAQIIRTDGATANIVLPPKVRLGTPTGGDGNSISFTAFRRTSPLEYGKAVVQLSSGEVSYKACTREEWIAMNPDFQDTNRFWFELLGDLAYVKMMNLPKDAKSDLPLRAKLGMVDCSPRFSYDNKFVVYQDAGALLVRDIQPIDTDTAKKLYNDALKLAAISKAKQVALGLIMCAADNDDVLPGLQGWEAKVDPYLKDQDMMKDFNYTFHGGDMNSLEDPAGTELGFVLAPGGRAVAYTDGHVKWIPNP